VPTDELDCAIYIDVPSEDDLMALLLAELPDARRDAGFIDAAGIALHVDRNDEADAVRRTEFPDGFLYFSHRVEAYADSPPAADLVTRLLERLWSEGWPAVAACDYEEKLPHAGGYKADQVPWPD
jgi:hypothetical protein